MRAFIVMLIGVVASLGLTGVATADPAPFNVSQFCSLNDDFPISFGSHGECVRAWHKNDATFLATACKDPINQKFTGTDNVGQCLKFFKALV